MTSVAAATSLGPAQLGMVAGGELALSTRSVSVERPAAVRFGQERAVSEGSIALLAAACRRGRR
jgi:hypothetical protein